MPEPTLYLFDGYNLLHAGGRTDVRELVDELAGFVAMKGARGVVVFDGVGEELEVGPLSVRYAPDADTLLERLAAEHRHGERVCLVSSDAAVRGHVGPGGAQGRPRPRSCGSSSGRRTSRTRRRACATGSIPETRAKLERLRRGPELRRRRPAAAGRRRLAEPAPVQPTELTARTHVLITVQSLQRGCNACKKVLGSPSTSG